MGRVLSRSDHVDGGKPRHRKGRRITENSAGFNPSFIPLVGAPGYYLGEMGSAGMRRVQAVLEWVGYLLTVVMAIALLRETRFGQPLWPLAGFLAAFFALLVGIFRTVDRASLALFLSLVVAASGVAVAIAVMSPRPAVGSVLLCLLCAQVALRFPFAGAVSWTVGAGVGYVLCLAILDGTWLGQLWTFAIRCGVVLAFIVALRRLLQKSAESEQLLAELREAQGRLRDLAIAEERARLAREMHDSVGHRLTVAAVLLEGAAGMIPPGQSRALTMVETSRAEVRRGLDELRATVSTLNANAEKGQLLSDALRALAELYAQGSGVRVTLDVQPGLREPDPDRKLVMIRTVQEALTNVQKHAAARRVEIALRMEDGVYDLSCVDNGRGLQSAPAQDHARCGYGLRNLRARAAVFGGRVDLKPAPEGGAALRLTLPAALS
jgi:signal transduction histidine kinase